MPNTATVLKILRKDAHSRSAATKFQDDVPLLFGSGASAISAAAADANVELQWDTTDANANALILQLPAGGSVDVPVIAIGQSIESVDLGLYNGVVDPRVAIFGVGAVATAAIVEFRKARGTITAPTVVTSGDDLGSIDFYGAVAAGEYVQAASIRADMTGTIATTRGPGNLSLNVATDAAPSVLTERILITGSGQINLTPATDMTLANGTGLIIGHTAQVAAGAVTSELQMHGTAPADSTALLAAWSADAVPPRLYFAKSRSATIGTFGIITTGDNLGEILAFGDDGVDFNSNGNASCAIIFDSAGTIAADRVPGVIRLQTATDAAPSVLTTALTIDQTQTVTCAAGLVAKSATAADITEARTLTAADSGGVFSVDKQTAYAITLPTPAQGLKFKFMVLDTGANAVTISNSSAHLFGVVSVNNVSTAMTGTTLSLASGGSVGDWVEIEGIDATHYLVTGACITAADIAIS